jgi:hypothetical protein
VSLPCAQVRYVVGGSLVSMPNDDAETRLQGGARAQRATSASAVRERAPDALSFHRSFTHTRAATEEAGAEVERLNAELEEIKGGMTKLKAVLYAKFGDSINLEE